MTLRELIISVDAEQYSDNALYQKLRETSTYRGLRIVYKYDDGFHDDFNVSEQLQIEYYD